MTPGILGCLDASVDTSNLSKWDASELITQLVEKRDRRSDSVAHHDNAEQPQTSPPGGVSVGTVVAIVIAACALTWIVARSLP